MGRAKEIRVKVIPAKIANEFVRKHHYSGKVVNNSTVHFGCFLDGGLHGVMSFGNSLDKGKIVQLVEGTKWNDFIELNRMAFDQHLPKNSESRCIAIAVKLLRRNAQNIKWIISFADGTQCGDGAIYRASGFVLTGVKESFNLCRLQSGEVLHKMTLESNPTSPRKELQGKSYYDVTEGRFNFRKYVEVTGGEILKGFQLRYIYFIDPKCKEGLTVPILPFSKIDEMGAGMYKGQKISLAERKALLSDKVESNATPDLE